MGSHPIRVAWETRDVLASAATFVEDGVFHSPVIRDPGIRGRRAIAELMEVVFEVTSDIEFTAELSNQNTHVLAFSTRFGSKPVKGVIVLDLDVDGMIRDLWMFVRPLTGVVAVAAMMGPGLSRRQSASMGVAARVLAQPLVGLAWAADRWGSMILRKLNRPTH